jgi:signal transduction histidine kinase
LEIQVRTVDTEVQVQVTDTGCGISGKNLDKVFDPFFTTSPVGQGTGLGLSLCYSIMREHKGTIEVESLEGRGSVFTVKMPIRFRPEVNREP